MGAYLYIYNGNVHVVKNDAPDAAMPKFFVGQLEYLCKPSCHDDLPGQIRRKMSAAANRTCPNYMIVGDAKEGTPIHHFAGRTDYAGKTLKPEAVFYDDPYGFGPMVGFLHIVGKRWHMKTQHVHQVVVLETTAGVTTAITFDETMDTSTGRVETFRTEVSRRPFVR